MFLPRYRGIELSLEVYLLKTKCNISYIKFKNADEVTNEYIKYTSELKKLVKTRFFDTDYQCWGVD